MYRLRYFFLACLSSFIFVGCSRTPIALAPVQPSVEKIDSEWLRLTSFNFNYTVRYPRTFMTYKEFFKLATTVEQTNFHGNGQFYTSSKLYDTMLIRDSGGDYPQIDAIIFVQPTTKNDWDTLNELNSVPLHSSIQWQEKKIFLAQAKPGDRCEELYKKYTNDSKNNCRVILFNSRPTLDRQMYWTPSAGTGRFLTFYQQDVRFDIGLPLEHFEEFSKLDTLSPDNLANIGFTIAKTLQFTSSSLVDDPLVKQQNKITPSEIVGEWQMYYTGFAAEPNEDYQDSFILYPNQRFYLSGSEKNLCASDTAASRPTTTGKWYIEHENELYIVFDCSASLGEWLAIIKKEAGKWTGVSLRPHTQGDTIILKKQ